MAVTPLPSNFDNFDIDQFFIDQFFEESTERLPVPLVDTLVPSEQEGQPEGADEHRQEGCEQLSRPPTLQAADELKRQTGGGQSQSVVDQSTWIGSIVKILPPAGVSLFLLGASLVFFCPNVAYGSPVPQLDGYTTSTTQETSSSRQRRRRRVERARSARRASSARRAASATSQPSGSINQATPERQASVSANQATPDPVTPVRFHSSPTPRTSNFYSPGTNAMIQYFHDADYTIDSVSNGRTEEHLNIHLKNEHGQSEHDVTLSAHFSPEGIRAKNTFRSILQ